MLQFYKTYFVALILLTALLLGSCGRKDIELEVVLASNSTENVLKKISQDMQLGVSAGVFFQLDKLNSSPASIDDVASGGDTYSEPSSGSVGFDPLVDAFKISTSALQSGSFYRIKMIARDASGNITHTGTGDCPIKVSFKEQNKVKICFGKNNLTDPPLCAGLTSFKDCPGT